MLLQPQLAITLSHLRKTREMQKILEILQFKLDLLWVISDSILLACSDIKIKNGIQYIKQDLMK
jgi:pyrroloquinoline-quinone synthase